jgi:membrane protein YdbS with pleckstrin-like domain
MPYPKKNLNTNETIALDMHPHWWYFAEPAAALFGASSSGSSGSPRPMISNDMPDKAAHLVAIALLVGITALWLIGPLPQVAHHQLRHHVAAAHLPHGVIAKSGIEIPLERVNNVNFSQSVFERMLGAGDLLIESGGEDGQQRFTDIRRPDKVQGLIHAQMELVAISAVRATAVPI